MKETTNVSETRPKKNVLLCRAGGNHRHRREALTGEVDGEARFGDVEVRLELDGDHIEGGVDPFRQQRAAHLLQGHLVVRRPIPHLQDVVGGLGVESQKLEANSRTTTNSNSVSLFFFGKAGLNLLPKLESNAILRDEKELKDKIYPVMSQIKLVIYYHPSICCQNSKYESADFLQAVKEASSSSSH